MEIYHKEINTIWLKAAVVGSLWGSIEIIVGSFFHNIKMPLAGTVLAVFGIIIISAFGQNWKESGLFWRAGLICAFMKSVSPSAVLIGPMTGIFLEALLFEFSIFIFGRNFFGYLIGGISALYSVIVHKVIALLIIYGYDLIKIFKNLYYYLIKQLNIQDISFLQAFLLISSAYVILGIFASLSGMYIGRKVSASIGTETMNDDVVFEKKYDFVQPTINTNSLFLLFLHLFLIVILLASINLSSFYISIPLVTLYAFFSLLKYRKSMRFIKKAGFWIQIFLFMMISSFFYNGFNASRFFTTEGFEAGIKMGLRAVTIVIAFSALSTELRNPLIKALLFRKGFWQLYTSLGLSFSVLPFLMDHSPRPKDLMKHPLKSVIGSLARSHSIYEKFKGMKNYTKVYAITGKIHEGKTNYTNELIEILKNKDLKLKGFLAIGNFTDNTRTDFHIQDIQTGRTEILCSSKGLSMIGKSERFIFHESGLDFGKKVLDSETIMKDEIVVIDEIGPYELKGKGWSESVEKLLNRGNQKMIWVVRNSMIYDIFRRFGIFNGIIFDISKDPVEVAAEIIEKDRNSV